MTTLRQQQRDVLDYLTLACQAVTLGSAPPSLVPAAPPAPPPLTRLRTLSCLTHQLNT